MIAVSPSLVIVTSPAFAMNGFFTAIEKPVEASEQEVKTLVELEHGHILQVLQKTGWSTKGKRRCGNSPWPQRQHSARLDEEIRHLPTVRAYQSRNCLPCQYLSYLVDALNIAD
jgi:hypothetical protein